LGTHQDSLCQNLFKIYNIYLKHFFIRFQLKIERYHCYRLHAKFYPIFLPQSELHTFRFLMTNLLQLLTHQSRRFPMKLDRRNIFRGLCRSGGRYCLWIWEFLTTSCCAAKFCKFSLSLQFTFLLLRYLCL